MADRAVFDAVCERIATGERIHAACSAEGITWRDLWNWKATDTELAALYARAREASAESWEDKGTEAVEATGLDGVGVQQARLKEDHYRWRASVANPRTHGSKIDVTSDGKELGLAGLLAGTFPKPASGSSGGSGE